MRILVTNDDGIHSVGLKALAEAAIRRGHQVTITAPNSQCSANSQHITLTQPLLAHEIAWPGATALAIDGTPTDCARIAPFIVDEPFDFCLSGINNGENAGSAVYYSGTVAAAREAAARFVWIPSKCFRFFAPSFFAPRPVPFSLPFLSFFLDAIICDI